MFAKDTNLHPKMNDPSFLLVPWMVGTLLKLPSLMSWTGSLGRNRYFSAMVSGWMMGFRPSNPLRAALLSSAYRRWNANV